MLIVVNGLDSLLFDNENDDEDGDDGGHDYNADVNVFAFVRAAYNY